MTDSPREDHTRDEAERAQAILGEAMQGAVERIRSEGIEPAHFVAVVDVDPFQSAVSWPEGHDLCIAKLMIEGGMEVIGEKTAKQLDTAELVRRMVEQRPPAGSSL